MAAVNESCFFPLFKSAREKVFFIYLCFQLLSVFLDKWAAGGCGFQLVQKNEKPVPINFPIK